MHRLMGFFSSILTLVSRLLHKSDPPPPPSPHDLEMAAEHNPQPVSSVVAGHHNLHWSKIMVAFCLTSAVEIAVLSVQTQSQLPPAFHLLSLSMSFAFLSVFFGIFIGAKYPLTARVLDQIGVFFSATAFFLAVTIPFPFGLKCTTWTVYSLALLAIIIFNCI